MTTTRRVKGGQAFRLTWLGGKIYDEAVALATMTMQERMLKAEGEAKGRLWPGHGVETGTMRARTHVAPGGHNWAAEHIDPVPGGGIELGLGGELSASDITPKAGRGGKISLELGVGQKYAIFYHQKVDAFLRIPFDRAMKGFKSEVERRWRAAFR